MPLALLSGATGGLGARLAVDLSTRGWSLLLPARDPARLAPLLQDLRSLGAPRPLVVTADLAEPDDVRSVCERAVTEGVQLVIGNAGLGGGTDPSERETNSRGTEARMAVNAVAPHLTARLLAPHLPADGRIVQVGSMGQAPLDLDDLDQARGTYDGVTAYLRSKLALVMSTIELGAAGIPVNVVHPAHLMPTTMVLESGFTPASTIDDGALPVLRAALDSTLSDVRGVYLDRFTIAEPHPQAADPAARRAVVDWLDAQAEATP